MRSYPRVAEYDAFGRKQGENPLEQLGSGGSVPPSEPAVPHVSAPLPAKPSRAVPLGVAALAVVLLAAMGAVGLLVASSPQSEGVTSSAGVPAQEPEPPAPGAREPRKKKKQTPAAAKPAAGLAPGSLLRKEELGSALKTLRAAELGTPVTFRVAADRIDVQVKTRDGRLRNVQVRSDGELRDISTSPPGFGQVPTFAWRAIDPAGPQRLVRAAAERIGRSAADVDYLVLMSLPNPTWGLFFKGGTHFQGDAAGKLIRRIS